MRLKRSERGFTLVELAAGAMFLTVALLGAVAAITSGSQLALETEETRVAQRTAASLMEEIRATPFDDLVDTFHGSAHPVVSPNGTTGSADIAVQQVTGDQEGETRSDRLGDVAQRRAADRAEQEAGADWKEDAGE